MESSPDLKFLRILENIRYHFDFLFRRGFHIVSVLFVDQNYENWQVSMMTDDYLIKIYSCMGKVNLALSTLQLYNDVGLFELNDLIYFINGNENFSDPPEEAPINETQSFQRIARLLEKYVDDILETIEKILILPSTDYPSITSNNPDQLSKDN
ncbi:MAG: hypothetical protein EHM33_05610 [Chloroflexi bacterium]|nr:MAG: hypothetical protein EHM33_05610 [Chloroflexota bacterium]